MVIGDGMIAKRFGSYAESGDVLVFASGVSNSSGAEEKDYGREATLLSDTIAANKNKTFVYFSTCSIYDPSLQESLYVKHKIKMEHLIQNDAPSYIIFRVSNPVGFSENPHTVLNFFIGHIKNNMPFNVWQYSSRNIIDIDDMFAICDHIIKNGEWVNSIINVANPVNYPVIDIVEAIEKYFNCKGNYGLLEKGNSPLIDSTLVQPLFSKLHIEFKSDYLSFLLHKYFPLS